MVEKLLRGLVEELLRHGRITTMEFYVLVEELLQALKVSIFALKPSSLTQTGKFEGKKGI